MALVHSLVPHWKSVCHVSHSEIFIISSAAPESVSFFKPRTSDTNLWKRLALCWLFPELLSVFSSLTVASTSSFDWTGSLSSTSSKKRFFSRVSVQKKKTEGICLFIHIITPLYLSKSCKIQSFTFLQLKATHHLYWNICCLFSLNPAGLDSVLLLRRYHTAPCRRNYNIDVH